MLTRDLIKAITEKPKPAVLPEPIPAKPTETGLFDDLFPCNREDLLRGFVYSLILARPRCRQRSGGPWLSK